MNVIEQFLNICCDFLELRRLVPTYPPDRKLSKNEILRLAIRYIRLLSSIVEWQDDQEMIHSSNNSNANQNHTSNNNSLTLSNANLLNNINGMGCFTRIKQELPDDSPPFINYSKNHNNSARQNNRK